MRFFDIVIARSINHVIGQDNRLPWSCKKDMAYFKKITTTPGPFLHPTPNILIMGRKTWESLPKKPLPNRIHIIVSSTLYQQDISNTPLVFISSSLDNALIKADDFPFSHVYVIGGAQLYKEAFHHPYSLKIYETIMDVFIQTSETILHTVQPIDPLTFSLLKESPKEIDENQLGYQMCVWKRKKTVLWWIDPSCYEKDWLDYLLKSTPHTPIVDSKKEHIIPNAIIIANQLLMHQSSFMQYHLTNTPYSLIHLSDEYLDDDTSCYNAPMCRHIFRNYYHPFLQQPHHSISSKITTFGIGYRNHFNLPTPPQNRIYQWSFAGYLKKSDRTQICQLFHSFQPYHLYETQGFNTGIMDASTYSTIVHQSKFVLCPIGNCSLDTFRLYEALEAGAIPVTLCTNINQPFIRFIGNYWEHIFGKHTYLPFVVNPTWEQNVQTMKYILEQPVIYERLQKELTYFWNQYKSNLQESFKSILWNTAYIE
jgi:dihydrofolate reductase